MHHYQKDHTSKAHMKSVRDGWTLESEGEQSRRDATRGVQGVVSTVGRLELIIPCLPVTLCICSRTTELTPKLHDDTYLSLRWVRRGGVHGQMTGSSD